MVEKGVRFICAPATIAASHWFWRMASTANCSAVADDEHAVSTANDGPRKSKKYAKRFANIDRVQPVNR